MIPFVQDADLTLYRGDALDVLAALPAESVHCVVTSPPYWALRDYAIEPTDWPEVTYSPLPGFELTVPPATCCLGLEADPYAFVGHLVAIFRELHRVVRPEATVWLNIGDSYASKARGSDRGWETSRLTNPGTVQKMQAASMRRTGERHRGKAAGLKNKDVVGIPWLLAFALRTDGWWLRAENIWDKANPMPESVVDRPAKSHEQVFLLTKSERCFYDYVAVRENTSGTANSRGTGLNPKALQNADASSGVKQNASAAAAFAELTARRNLRSVWKVASRPYTGAHFAVFPPDLIEPCILAGTSAGGCCSACGAPREPVNEKRTLGRHELPHDHPEYRPARYVGKHDDTNGGGQRYLDVVTVGWTPSCACHAATSPCVVLDPFMGAGTTALVARKHGRHAVGIEKSPEYAGQIAERLSQQSLLADALVVEVVEESAPKVEQPLGQIREAAGVVAPLVQHVDQQSLITDLERHGPARPDRVERADDAGAAREVADPVDERAAGLPRDDDLSAAVSDDDAFVAAELVHEGEPTSGRAA